MLGGMWRGAARRPRGQPGLRPLSVLVLVFLLVFLNFIILRGCKSFLEGVGEEQVGYTSSLGASFPHE